MPARLDPDLARDIEVRLEDLLAAVDRWSAPLADTLDRVVDDSAGPLEDLLRSVQSGRPAHEDELAVLRAERALTSLLLELAGLAAALRLGPPATAAYRLRALISATAAATTGCECPASREEIPKPGRAGLYTKTHGDAPSPRPPS